MVQVQSQAKSVCFWLTLYKVAFPLLHVEHLNALGWKISSVGGGHDEIVQAGRKLAQELGFPVTQEGCMVSLKFNLDKNAKMTPEMAALLRRAVEIENNDVCITSEEIVAVTGGTPYLDVEDVTTARWIRIHLVTGMLFCAPTGAKFHLAVDERSSGATETVFFKDTIYNQTLLVKEEIDNHPIRQAYLSTLA
ncbi:hypothetical protein BDP27DRAFT_1347939 [Rhodocollybia butyracea]|uniref:Uncharacterized protein n=1 Tax=Rhodocollybia butyracea TaxID=206335 RepID=A0A9P5P5T1_9AGAR|nr:hypothetical protein BDP27DRAFT_1347939 [Rhodocollybia butyracea]